MAMLRKRPMLAWLAVVLFIGGTAGGLAYRHHKRYKHLEVHDPGMVYRSAWLEAEVFAELIEKYQIRTVINLCNPGEMGEDRCLSQRQAVRGSGAQLLEMPMPATIDAGDAQVAKYVEVLSDPNNYPLLIHCQHGVTRTAKLLAIYDILFRHLTAEQSLAAMPLFGRNDYNVSVHAFARDFESQRAKQFESLANRLDVLKRR